MADIGVPHRADRMDNTGRSGGQKGVGVPDREDRMDNPGRNTKSGRIGPRNENSPKSA